MFSDEKWYSNNNPTRKARLNYILMTKYGNDVLLDFIEKDIEAIIAFFEIFQKGTHEIVSSIGPNQLRSILKRAKMLICELINKETS
jgi:hypothetical protein